MTNSVMTMFSFRVESSEGNMERLKKMHGNLLCFKYASIRILPQEPDLSDFLTMCTIGKG